MLSTIRNFLSFLCISFANDTFNDFRLTERSINDELRCKVNSSKQCNSRWIRSAFDGSSAVLGDQSTVKANISGIYRCESECNIRGKQCAVSAMLVHIPNVPDNMSVMVRPGSSHAEVPSSADSDRTALIIVVAILGVLIVAYIVTLLLCCVNRKRKDKSDKGHLKETMELLPDENNHVKQQPNGNNPGESKPANDDSFDEPDGPRQDDEHEELSNERQKNESLTKELETREKEIDELKKQWSKEKDELDQQKRDLNSEANALKMKLEESERENAALQEEIIRLVKSRHELSLSIYLPPKEPFEYKVEPSQTIKTLASQGPKNVGVCGLAVLDKELFVISDGHPEVEVYDMSTFKHSRNIKLDGVTDPGDIVACNINKRIYIVDWTERNLKNKMLRLDANGKEHIHVERLSIPDDECRLFVTRDANVLVTFHRSRRIVEYRPAPDWSVVFKTKIKDANIFPNHSVKLSNGLLAICHGIKKETTHRVSIVDDDGNLLKSFGGRKGSGVGQVNCPTYLAVDKSDNILVTDQGSGRVLVLNSRLELAAELLAKTDKLRFPRALLLDETNSRLVVADCNEKFLDGQVLVFNLK